MIRSIATPEVNQPARLPLSAPYAAPPAPATADSRKTQGVQPAGPVAQYSERAWRLTIPGEPIAKARPKLGTVNGHAMAFTPKRTRSYEDIVRQTAIREWNRPLLDAVAITMSVVVFRGIGKSWPKKRQQAAMLGELRPLGRPDWDNFGKLIADSMNGVVYLDDSLIVDARVQKFYALEPRVEISIRW